MTVRYGFFNSINKDRMYNAEDMGRMFEGIITYGVAPGYGDRFKVTKTTESQVSIGTGKAWLHGRWFMNDEPYAMSITDGQVIYIHVDEKERVIAFESGSSVPEDTTTSFYYPIARMHSGKIQQMVGMSNGLQFITGEKFTLDPEFHVDLSSHFVDMNISVADYVGNNYNPPTDKRFDSPRDMQDEYSEYVKKRSQNQEAEPPFRIGDKIAFTTTNLSSGYAQNEVYVADIEVQNDRVLGYFYLPKLHEPNFGIDGTDAYYKVKLFDGEPQVAIPLNTPNVFPETRTAFLRNIQFRFLEEASDWFTGTPTFSYESESTDFMSAITIANSTFGMSALSKPLRIFQYNLLVQNSNAYVFPEGHVPAVAPDFAFTRFLEDTEVKELYSKIGIKNLYGVDKVSGKTIYSDYFSVDNFLFYNVFTDSYVDKATDQLEDTVKHGGFVILPIGKIE